MCMWFLLCSGAQLQTDKQLPCFLFLLSLTVHQPWKVCDYSTVEETSQKWLLPLLSLSLSLFSPSLSCVTSSHCRQHGWPVAPFWSIVIVSVLLKSTELLHWWVFFLLWKHVCIASVLSGVTSFSGGMACNNTLIIWVHGFVFVNNNIVDKSCEFYCAFIWSLGINFTLVLFFFFYSVICARQDLGLQDKEACHSAAMWTQLPLEWCVATMFNLSSWIT